jgi:hypothetical protein
VMKFISGNYSDDGHPYESSIAMLPLSNDVSAYASSDISLVSVCACVSETSCLMGKCPHTVPPRNFHCFRA